MEVMIKPERIEDLSPEQLKGIMERSMEDISTVYEEMRKIVEDIRENGDAVSLKHYKKHKEDISLADLEATQEEIAQAYKQLDSKVVDCLKIAAENITKFHRAQLEREMWSIEVSEGILAGRMTRAMDIVGCYIPGGTAAYPSSILMTVLPAKVAGVRTIVAVTPPSKGMVATPATLVAADLAGCDRIFKVGGPWGVASLAYGTETIPRVDKIVGPGNKYVTAAKMIVYGQVDIDSPAGPSEALILADETGDADLIAVDFLSQIEHDPDSAAVLVTTSQNLAKEVCDLINREFDSLPRKEIFESSLTKHSHVLVAKDMEQAIDFTNEYATEHLQILTEDPFITLNKINHAGSIFWDPMPPCQWVIMHLGRTTFSPRASVPACFRGFQWMTSLKSPRFNT